MHGPHAALGGPHGGQLDRKVPEAQTRGWDLILHSFHVGNWLFGDTNCQIMSRLADKKNTLHDRYVENSEQHSVALHTVPGQH